jgi:protein-disulfide isomerase
MTAGVTIVEFTDFQCPFCAAYARETFGRIRDEYVKTGKVRYVSRDFPLEQLHPLAMKAAEAAACARDQGKYWELHDRFFADQNKLSVEDLPEQAAAISADAAALRQCLDKGKYTQRVVADIAEGKDLGLQGTPSFFVGYQDPQNPGRIHAVKMVAGNSPYPEFQQAIDDALKALRESGRATQ